MENVQAVSGHALASKRSRLMMPVRKFNSGKPLIDIGTTSLTGIQVKVISEVNSRAINLSNIGHPTQGTVPLSAAGSLYLGSDFVRTGFLFDPPEIKNGQWTDIYGLHWLYQDDMLSPLKHPLENAELVDIVRHPKPSWNLPLQIVESNLAENNLVIAEMPCPGLLDLCFMVRGTWQFMQDIMENWRIASALMEWSMDVIEEAYAGVLSAMERQPDVIVYSDDLGFADSMYFSPLDFRNHLRPRLHALLSRLRRLTSAPICFHSCGDIHHILKDISDMGVDIFNLDTKIENMAIEKIRKQLPASAILHGSVDLCVIGKAVTDNNKAEIARLITELAQSGPAIAAPSDSLCSIEQILNAARGAAFLNNIEDEEFDDIRQFGPVRKTIENALEVTLSTPQPNIESILKSSTFDCRS